MWQGGQGSAGPPESSWNVGAAEFVPGGRAGPPMGPPGGSIPAPMGSGGPPSMPPRGPPQSFPGFSAHWQPGMPVPNMPMPGPGYAWHQQQGGRPPMRSGAYGGHVPGNMGVPGPAEQPPEADVPDEPQAWAAIWNLPPQMDEGGLNSELEEIDFIPDKYIRVKELDGAFLLGYREHPFLADALWVALNDTKGHVKDNGETIRVVKCKKDVEAMGEVPPQILTEIAESLPELDQVN